MTIECSQSVHSIVMGFILLRVLEFFVFRKMEMPETKKKYIQDQEKNDIMQDKLGVKEYENPFKG